MVLRTLGETCGVCAKAVLASKSPAFRQNDLGQAHQFIVYRIAPSFLGRLARSYWFAWPDSTNRCSRLTWVAMT